MSEKKLNKEGGFSEDRTFMNLLDINSLAEIFNNFSEINQFSIELVTYPNEELLIRTGVKEVFGNPQNTSPRSESHSHQYKRELFSDPENNKEILISHCQNGLVEGAARIIIKGKHLATLTLGQVLFENPTSNCLRNAPNLMVINSMTILKQSEMYLLSQKMNSRMGLNF